jgi:hypothetical protein
VYVAGFIKVDLRQSYLALAPAIVSEPRAVATGSGRAAKFISARFAVIPVREVSLDFLIQSLPPAVLTPINRWAIVGRRLCRFLKAAERGLLSKPCVAIIVTMS